MSLASHKINLYDAVGAAAPSLGSLCGIGTPVKDEDGLAALPHDGVEVAPHVLLLL